MHQVRRQASRPNMRKPLTSSTPTQLLAPSLPSPRTCTWSALSLMLHLVHGIGYPSEVFVPA
jgi:hypothetical protein